MPLENCENFDAFVPEKLGVGRLHYFHSLFTPDAVARLLCCSHSAVTSVGRPGATQFVVNDC